MNSNASYQIEFPTVQAISLQSEITLTLQYLHTMSRIGGALAAWENQAR